MHGSPPCLSQDTNEPQIPQGCIFPQPKSSSSIPCKPAYRSSCTHGSAGCFPGYGQRFGALWRSPPPLPQGRMIYRTSLELRITFRVALGRCRNWYRWQAKQSMPAQRHAVMVSTTFHLLSSGPTAWSARFTNTNLTQVYQKWQRTDRALSLMYLR